MSFKRFGLACKALRIDRMYTQEELAFALGVSPSAISRMEHGAVPIKKNRDRIISLFSEKEIVSGILSGEDYSAFSKRNRLEQQFCMKYLSMESDALGEIVLSYKELMRKNVIEEVQKYETMKVLWYQNIGLEKRLISEELINIYQMSKRKFPFSCIKHKLSNFELFLLNNIAISYMVEHKISSAYNLFVQLFEYCSNIEQRSDSVKRILSAICNNLAIAEYCQNELHRAWELLQIGVQWCSTYESSRNNSQILENIFRLGIILGKREKTEYIKSRRYSACRKVDYSVHQKNSEYCRVTAFISVL